jgi:pyruvate/2-oxoglutarate dehydrogenase complex dihydrolipoamide acyltransferase (E2) component
MPQLGQSITEATLLTWFKQVGQAVAADEPLFEVETDKSSFQVPAPQAGTLVERGVEEGMSAPCGAVVATIEAQQPAPVTSTSTQDPQQEQPAQSNVRVHTRSRGEKPARMLSPRVRSLLAQHGLREADIQQVPGTGIDGRVTARDLETWIQQQRPYDRPVTGQSVPSAFSPLPNVPFQTRPIPRARRTIARVLERSIREVPQAYTVHDVDCTRLVEVRQQLKSQFRGDSGGPLTFFPFFLRAFCEVTRDFPLVNASWLEDEIRVYDEIHMGLAVALDTESLAVPVLPRADRMSFRELAGQTNDLIRRARARRLHPSQTEGATVTVTNFGSVGAILAAPILIPPQAVMLGIGKVEKRPVVKGDGLSIAPRAYFTCTFDHRLFDGAYAAGFLSAFGEWLENVDADEIMAT